MKAAGDEPIRVVAIPGAVSYITHCEESRLPHLLEAALMPRLMRCCLAVLVLFGCAGPLPIRAAGPRVLPAGQRPADQRLQGVKDLNGYFPFEVPASREAWQQRAEQVRRQMLVALGLWPMPTKTPLQEVLHGRVDREDYTVEKVYFQSLPGFYVTGNLYRPKGKTGKLPGVLCPHGHWANGRFYEVSVDQVQKDIASGAELYEEGGRSPLQARCVQLARMGCVVFHYDMLGYADSTQIPSSVAHGFSKQRPEMNTRENWGLFSPQAESQLQSVMGLQTINSIRALDFLASLPDVDAQRIGVTGASGGGTQTFVLCALDPRPVVAFPAVMVSTAMQGGCTCENASLLRVGTGNVEFAALFAPKPLGLTAADDWTKEMTTKGLPELQQLYRLVGEPDHVMLLSRLEFGHNYNAVSRAAMYDWFHQHLNLDAEQPIKERDYRRLSQEEMSVWNEAHPRPEGGEDFERRLLKHWTEDAQQQLAALTPRDPASWKKYQEVVGGAVGTLFGRQAAAAEEVEYEQVAKADQGTYLRMAGLLRNTRHREELPVAFLYPKEWNGHAVIWLSEAGKGGIFGEDGNPLPAVQRLVDAGASVAAVDLLYQGEFLAEGESFSQTPRVSNSREAAAYTLGYNRAVFAQRVHDVLTLIGFVKHHERAPKRISLVAVDATGPLAAAARSQVSDLVQAAAIDTGHFRFIDVPDIRDPALLPGGAKYGDLPGLLALGAPGRLWLAGEGDKPPSLVQSAYQALDAADAMQLDHSPEEQQAEAAVSWLLGR